MKNNMDHLLAALAKQVGVEFMQKAAFTTSDLNSASLKNEDAERFINQVVDESVLLKACRLHMTDSPSGDISKLYITGPVTRKSTENTEFTATRKPSNTVVSFNTVKSTSAIDISGEVAEDNVEGMGGKSTILQAMLNQIANDMETLAIEGDDSISGSTDLEELLKTNDGWYVKTDVSNGCHQLDAAGKRVSLQLLSHMKRLMPTKWRKNLNDLRFIMSANVAEDLCEELANYGGGTFTQSSLTDTLRTMGGLPRIHGIEPLVVPLLPEDLTIDGTAGDTGSFIWLTNPKNLIYVVQRQLTVEWERKPRKDIDEGTVHMRTDFVVEEYDAVVRCDNVNLDSDVTRYGVSA